MQQPRMTTRRWMIAVAGLAALFWPGVMIRRATSYRRKAAAYAAMERAGAAGIAEAVRERAKFRRAAQASRSEGDAPSAEFAAMRASFWSGQAEWSRELEGYGAGMRRKYRRASWRPWEPVATDPPPPPLGYPNAKHAPPTLRWAPSPSRKRL